MRSTPAANLRTLIVATCLLALSGCASLQKAVDSVRGTPAPAPEPEQVEPVPEPTVEPATPAQEPAKPARRPKPAPAPEPEPQAEPAPAPTAAPEPVPGPAWLKKCLSAQFAGGVVRCDSDLLLAKPSATVQVFTRDPARVVKGKILLRHGLPYVYRLYVVP